MTQKYQTRMVLHRSIGLTEEEALKLQEGGAQFEGGGGYKRGGGADSPLLQKKRWGGGVAMPKGGGRYTTNWVVFRQ